MNKLSLPTTSDVQIKQIDGIEQIVLPTPKRTFLHFIFSGFLLLWLFGWLAGLIGGGIGLFSSNGPVFFILIWLVAWLLGGAFASYMFYRLVRKPIPETFALEPYNLRVDTGIPPIQFYFGFVNPREYWKSLFHKRKWLEFDKAQIKTLALRETGEGNRLTIDNGNERLTLAQSATEIEREWLYYYLIEHYF